MFTTGFYNSLVHPLIRLPLINNPTRSQRVLVSFLIIYMYTTSVFAGDSVRISGKVRYPSCKSIRFVTFTDYITRTPVILANAPVVRDSFSVTFELSRPAFVQLISKKECKEAYFFPGNTYVINFINDSLKTPFFPFTAADPGGVNLKLQELNSLVNEFIFRNETSIITGRAIPKVRAFSDSLIRKYNFKDTPVLSYALDARIAELQMSSRSASPEKAAAWFFKRNPMNWQNPDYTYIFSQLYRNWLNEQLTGKNYHLIKELIREGSDTDKLDSLISIHPLLSDNKSHRQMMLLLNLIDYYDKKDSDKRGIRYLIDHISTNGISDTIRFIAIRSREIINKPASGDKALQFIIISTSGKEKTIAKPDEKYTYFCFFDPTLTADLKEIAAIPQIQKEFGYCTDAIAIAVNADTYRLKQLEIEYGLQNHVFNLIDTEVLKSFKIRSTPACFFVGPTGYYLETFLPSPSRNAAHIINNHVRNVPRPNR